MAVRLDSTTLPAAAMIEAWALVMSALSINKRPGCNKKKMNASKWTK